MTGDIQHKVPVQKHKVPEGWYSRFISGIEGAYFGIVAMSIAVAGIFGGVALSFIFRGQAQIWQLVLSIGLVLGNMIIPVAQQKLKPIITLFLVSIAVNSLLIAINVFISEVSRF